MQFRINTVVYQVKRRWRLSVDGVRLDGHCCDNPPVIYLDAELTGDFLLRVLRHEHAHANQFEICSPSEFEQVAQFAAAVGHAFEEQFNAQGGLAALLQLPIEGDTINTGEAA